MQADLNFRCLHMPAWCGPNGDGNRTNLRAVDTFLKEVSVKFYLPSEKGSTLKGKNLQGANSFLLE